MPKKILIVFFVILCTSFTKASSNTNFDEIYDEQFKISKAYKLHEHLPQGVLNSLKEIGLTGVNVNELSKISPSNIFDSIIKEFKNKSQQPIKSVIPVISIIIICSIVGTIEITIGTTSISEILSAISSICICICVVYPLSNFIIFTAETIKSASNFILFFIPVMVTVMIASGQTVSASSYHIMMTTAGQLISNHITNSIVPLINTTLGLSVISSLSPKLKINNITNSLQKIISYSLKICASIFTILLTLQNLIASPADKLGGKAAKLAFSSFVPIVGSAIGDAFNAIHGSLKLLKSGVGIFGVIAGGFIFLPSIVECLMWMFLLSVCVTISDIMLQKQISSLLKSINKVTGIILALILSCMTIFVVSTLIIILIGNGG